MCTFRVKGQRLAFGIEEVGGFGIRVQHLTFRPQGF